MPFNDTSMVIKVDVPFYFGGLEQWSEPFRRNYFFYQCRLPIDDWISIDICKQKIDKRVCLICDIVYWYI